MQDSSATIPRHARPPRAARAAPVAPARPVVVPFPGAPRAPSPRAKPLVPTIYHEDWWLEIASEGRHQEATVSSGGEVVGRLPYMAGNAGFGQTALVMPPLTNVLGPALAPGITTEDAVRSLRQHGIVKDLVAQLPKAAHVWFRMHRCVLDTMAFEAAGYGVGVDFTVEIAPAPGDVAWRQMRDKTRNVIRRAEERFCVTDRIGADEFLDLYDRNLDERGLRNRRPRPVVHALVTESVRRNAGRLLAARDANGTAVAAIFTVWNEEVEHYLLSTRSTRSGNGAIPLLIWTALQRASLQRRIFDTDGLMPNANLTLLTGFGGQIRPRHIVTRSTEAYRITERARMLRDMARRMIGRRGA